MVEGLTQIDLQDEASALASYLLGVSPSEVVVRHYRRAMECHSLEFEAWESRVWQRCLESPSLLGCVDGALALLRPNSAIRKRILLMQAILESVPEHAEQFLPQEHGRLYLLILIWTGIKAVFRTLLGCLLLWIL